MTPEQHDALTLEVMDSIEPRYQHDITIFARRYRAALAEKMEPVLVWVGLGPMGRRLHDSTLPMATELDAKK